MKLEDFEALLDGHGGDRTRWPLDQRAAANRLLAQDADARRLLAEAQALDSLLDRRPAAGTDLDALAARIVATAQRSPRLAASAPGAALAAKPSVPLRRRGPFEMDSVGIGALLTAASLVLGILIGLSGLPQAVLRPVQQFTGLPVASAQSTHASSIDTLDEDLL
ncbi:MAG: hypothetical protein EKK41_13205 [Hyphomicrobiales bacterium]|nr:MAG: hypothetical protein EKK41_13205 [Hyphomicrobiales bacterium]